MHSNVKFKFGIIKAKKGEFVRNRGSNMNNMKTKAWSLEKSLKLREKLEDVCLLHAQLPWVTFVLVDKLSVLSVFVFLTYDNWILWQHFWHKTFGALFLHVSWFHLMLCILHFLLVDWVSSFYTRHLCSTAYYMWIGYIVVCYNCGWR